ncbi:MAG: hypothetical protein QXW98_06695 [Candidatus Caldarchaeum sp.]
MRLLLWATLAISYTAIYAQQTAQIDFFAESGSFEVDYNRDGREDNVSHFVENGVSLDHIRYALDYNSKFGGTASQRIELARPSGGAGRYVLHESVKFNSFLKPAVGEALLVRVAVRASTFQNATYEVFVTTGSRRVTLLPATSEPIPDWRVFSAVVPVEVNRLGDPVFVLNLQIRVNEGPASGIIWIDESQAISTRTVMRLNQLPNSLKLCLSFLHRNSDGYRYIDSMPFGIVLGTREVSRVFRRHYADTIFAPYTFFPGTLYPEHTRHNGDLYNYNDLLANHPDWFLRDQNGQLIQLDASYYVNIGLPEVRERAWQSLRDFLPRCGYPRYVYLDNTDVLAAQRYSLSAYPNNDLWVQAVIGWFDYVGSRVRNEFGTTFIPNVAWAPGFWLRGIAGHPDAPGVATLPYIGGFLIEHAFMRAQSNGRYSVKLYGTSTGNLSPAVWNRRLVRDTVRLVHEYPDKIAILIHTLWTNNNNPDSPDYSPRRLRYVLAGSLIIQHENTYIHLDARYEPEQYPSGYYPPELFVPLGRWTEDFRILNGDLVSGGLFVRNYENGIVVWNPTHDRDFTFTVPRDLYDWDRNLIRAGTVVQIPRQTGHVFYSAPEITVELSPQNAQVLPGQTVQFTVTYRNRGTAPGTNVRVAVPLPQGMTLVGSNPTARLENGQVVWVVPNVPVGGQGTLQFTVRVE